MIKAYGYGRLTRDPETRVVGNSKVTNFSLASNEVYYKDGEKHEKTTFTDWQVWNGSGENLVKIAGKGDLLFVDGKYGVSEWTDAEGNKRSRPQFTALAWQLLSKVGGAKADEVGEDNEKPKPKAKKERATPKPAPVEDDDSDDDSDIPF